MSRQAGGPAFVQPGELSHEALLRSLADARDEDARAPFLEEARRRLQRVREPRRHDEDAPPWDAANGGC